MLFEPFSISGLTLKNRIVRAATYERAADNDGLVTDAIIDIYEALAKGGCGLIITGNTLVHPSGRAQAQMLSIHSDIYIPDMKRLTDAVHKYDCPIAVQLSHGGRQSPSSLLGGERPLAPSEVYNSFTETMPKAMTDDEIWQTVDAFGEAARRAQAAGFDAIEIHAAHGFLISSFLSPLFNLRNDYWGGDEERRFHLIEEICKSVRETVGREFPLIVKLNSEDFLLGGVTVEESLRIARRLEAIGVDAVEVSGGTRESELKPARLDVLGPKDEAYFRGAGGLFKKSLSIPVILTGGMRSRTVMEDVLLKGEADLIGVCRPLIREPNLPNLMQEGKDVADCVSCNRCMKWASPLKCRRKKTPRQSGENLLDK